MLTWEFSFSDAEDKKGYQCEYRYPERDADSNADLFLRVGEGRITIGWFEI
jgi:hypothetical protein